MSADPPPTIVQVNVAVTDMAASVRFYAAVGLPVPDDPTGFHVGIDLPGGLSLELDQGDFVGQWDTGWTGTTGGGPVFCLGMGSSDAVDAAYQRAVASGGAEHQPPYDAFFGARFAIVDDPDGTCIGLISPVEDARKFWPPGDPPRAPAPIHQLPPELEPAG